MKFLYLNNYMMRSKIAAARRKQTCGEEIANSILHGVGVLFAVAGLVLLVFRAGTQQSAADAKPLAACVIYAATLITLFLASTLYHAITHERAKQILRIFDHSAIYLLIAGTYTPVCLLLLPPAFGLTLVIAEWTLAVAGITLYALNIAFLKKIELVIYLLMGWALAAGGPLILHDIPRAALVLLVAGGAAFSLGVLFYKKHERRFFHVIWHTFVLAGAALQWSAVYHIF